MYHETILAGVLVSLLYTEFTGLSAGLIVPGYLALCLHFPWRIVDTLVIAAVAVGICKLLSKSIILYGRRRFAFLLVLTFFLSLLAQEISLFPSGGIVIGTLIPFQLMTNSLRFIKASTASLLDAFEPFSATVGSVICFGLVMTPMDWIGSILVVLAAMALNISPKKKKVKKAHQ